VSSRYAASAAGIDSYQAAYDLVHFFYHLADVAFAQMNVRGRINRVLIERAQQIVAGCCR
jgi:hypothetical protein